jgi:hypothetical protein
LVDAVKRRIVAAIALLFGAWLISPTVMPLYDGPGQPDQPYRYVAPPPGDTVKTPAPTTATTSMPVRNGVNTAAFANSAEVGPQVRVYVPAGAFRAPAGASSIQLTATPSAPKAPLPSDGTIVGNVYTITATAPGGPVDIVGTGEDQAPVLQMRAPSAKQPGPIFETFDGKTWKSSTTIRAGQDVYQTSAPKLGVWALVQENAGGSGLGGAQLVMLILGITILLLVGVIMVIRMVRARAEPPAKRTAARR